MKALSKFSLLIAAFAFIVMSGTRFVLGAWHPLLYVFLAVFSLALLVSFVLNYKMYFEILSVKTAKKGLSLGWSLLLLFIFLSAFSYFGHRFDKTFDLTTEKLNSLSEQSHTALKNVDSPLTFYIFYKSEKSPDQARIKQQLKNSLNLYRQINSNIKFTLVDTSKNPAKAETYLADLPDKHQQNLFIFVNYKDRKVRVDAPFGEEALTSAIIKSQKREFKDIFFLVGHGERVLNSSEPGGLKILKQSLSESGFQIRQWNFAQQGKPQKAPALIASLGPRQNFLEAEKNWLKDYLSQGGSLVLSLDPKEKHNLQDFLKDYGLIYKDNFILSQLSLLYGAGVLTAIGPVFDPKHPITKKISSKQTAFFERASAIEVEPKAFEKFKFSFLVRTDKKNFVTSKIENKQELINNILPGSKQLDSYNIALAVSPKQKEQDKQKKLNKNDFQLLVFGDSDFLSNRYIFAGANKDLILNTFVFLAGEEELISIRPKQPKGTKVTLNRYQQAILVLIYIILPLIFLITGLWLWYKRRSA